MTDEPATILDRPLRTEPARLDPSIPAIRTLYRRAKRRAWDPATAVPWAEVHPEQYPDDVLAAARRYYSGRAWGEYGAISESPVLQLRYERDELEADLSLFWALRTQEEARHAEISAEMAERLGGYLAEPPAPPAAPAAADTDAATAGSDARGALDDPPAGPYLGTRARALAPDYPVEATIAGLVCVAETVVYDVFVSLVRHLRNPAAKAIFRLIVSDEVRHCDFGWAYLEHRRAQLTPAVRRDCRDAMATMVQDVELGGYRTPWLAPDRDPDLVASERLVFDAGLGGSNAEWEGPVLVRSVQRIRDRIAPLGIDLPRFHHPALGSF